MIVITAPTGNIGRQLLNNVLDSGKPIRVIARHPSRLPSNTRQRIDVVQGRGVREPLLHCHTAILPA
jgi:uncharacterized protein YbjT (DUF2867 family)